MAENLLIYAGTKALHILRERGLHPADIDVVAGAAGGPKWLVLGGLDRAIFFDWLAQGQTRRFFIGSSIGSWRFTALAQGTDAYDRLEQAYIRQRYRPKPSAAEVTRESKRIMDAFLDYGGIQKILNHPSMRVNMMAVRCRGPFSREGRLANAGGMALAAGVNMVHRQALGLFFSRALFHDPRETPPFFDGEESFDLERIALTPDNFYKALLASGSIPVVMEGVNDIPGAKPGVYRDGGVIDYNLDLPFGARGLVLYPHFFPRLIPGWFDKMLPWRKPQASHMENVVLLCPSPAFIERLPGGHVPDRNDFALYQGRDDERIRAWDCVVESCRLLGQEFLDLAHGNSIKKLVRPLAEL